MKNLNVRRALAIVLATVFIDIMGFGILIPLMPVLLTDRRSPYDLLGPAATPASGYILLGFLIAAFPIMQFLASPVLGQLSDRYGRKKIMFLSLAGTSLSYFIFAFGIHSRNLPLLFFSRALDGATGGVVAVAQASIADITAPETRVRNFALLAAMFSLGFIGGPFLGGKLSDPRLLPWFTAVTPFLFSGSLSLLNAASVWFFFPETCCQVRPSLAIHWKVSFQNIRQAFTHPVLGVLFLVNYLYQSGFAFYVTFAGVFMIHRFGFDQGAIGDYFAFVGICGLVTQLVVVRRVAMKIPAHRVLTFSLFLTAGFALLASLTRRGWEFVALAPCFSVFSGLTQTNSTGLVSASADAGMQGRVLGINASVQALSLALPPILSGLIAAMAAPATPLVVAAGLMAVSGLVFSLYARPGK